VDREAGSYVTNRYRYDHPQFPHYITSIENAAGVPITRNEYDAAGRLTAVVDADGGRIQIIHNITNRLELTIDRLGNTNTIAYDTRGNITATTNALGGITLMACDDLGNKTNVVQFLNGQPYATNRAMFDANGWLLASFDALGHSNLFQYNEYGQITNSVDARGFGMTNWYGERGNLLRTADALGNETTNAYTSAGLPFWSRDAVGTVMLSAYDADGNLTGTSATDASGILSTNSFVHDENGNITESVAWRHVGEWVGATNLTALDAQGRAIVTADPLGFTNAIIYNSLGRQEATIDKLGRTNRFEYDWQGRLWRTLHPDGNTDVSYFDPNGNRTNSLDRGGRATAHCYDALGRVSHTVSADGATNRTIYDDLGRVRFSIDARGTTNAFGYDCLGRRTSVTNAWGRSEQQVFRYGFDENGNQTWALDPSGVGITNIFDPLNRLVEVEFADGTSRLTGFDAAGRKVAETNQDNVVTLFGFDGVGRLLSVTNALGTTNQIATRYTYDEAGNQTAQIDALGRTNTFGFNLLSQRVWHTMPGGQTEWFAYNAAGNLVQHTNFNGLVITNEYDLMNRLTNISAINGYNVQFTYTATGMRESMTDPTAFTTYHHDDRDRLTNKIVAWNNGPTVTLHYSHDANGNVTNIWSDTLNGVNLAYAYDPLNRLTNVLANGSLAAGYGFDASGNLQIVRYGNGVTNLCQHDSLNRLTNMVWKSGTTPLASFAYQLGRTGSRTNLSETVSSTTRTYAWSYDALYRLRQETISGFGSVSYGLDSVGNRTNRDVTGSLNLTNQSFGYTTNDWLTSDGYDANGNTISSGANAYYYDPLNRLTNFNNTVYFGYDGDGNRITKTADGVTTYFLIADRNPTGYAQALEEHQASGGASNLARVYTFGLSLISQREASGAIYYFVSDGHGSTRLLADTNAAVVNAFTYDAYGNLIASNAPPQTAHLYCGEYFDEHLGMIYLRARIDNLQTGRFWTRDAWEGNCQDPQSLHKYLYAHGNPVMMTDPSGHESLASVNFSMAIISQMVMHDLRGANGALKGARALFGSDDSLDSIIYGLDVIGIVDEKVGQVALGAAGVYGGIKVAGWIKNTFGSTRIAQEVLASLKKLAAKFPGRPKPSGGLGQYIYRTITPGDPHYQQFKNVGDTGSIAPRGGHNDLTLHVQENQTDSIFTSWSKNQDANFKDWGDVPGSVQLRINVSELENPAIDLSQWSHFPQEEEVTVIGTILKVERVR
jgi:RHS repeat-associated protein